MASDLGSAIRNLFQRLGANPDDEALLAVDLFAAKEDIAGSAQALPEGNAADAG